MSYFELTEEQRQLCTRMRAQPDKPSAGKIFREWLEDQAARQEVLSCRVIETLARMVRAKCGRDTIHAHRAVDGAAVKVRVPGDGWEHARGYVEVWYPYVSGLYQPSGCRCYACQ